MCAKDNLVIYHCHSDYSLLDSTTDYKLYVDRAKELGQPAIGFSEHGKLSGWVSKKMYCDEVGIKYLHGVECYLTEDLNERVRDNYHTVLIAKNYNGVMELNDIISKSFAEDHFYYVNRISFDEFLSLSDNIIKISACLGSPLNKLPITHNKYISLVKHYDYLEIQPYDHPDQIAFNVHLSALAKKYNKPLIAGTDTHSLNEYKAECRKMLLIRKHKSYGDEDLFDLTFKSRDELIYAFQKQNSIPEDIYISAINNTVVMANSVEDFTLDTSIKYPILYGSKEKDIKAFSDLVSRKFKEKVESGVIAREQIEGFEKAIEEEMRVFSKVGMEGFMLSMSELSSWCKDSGIPMGNARGSVAGSRIAYLTDIIDLNPETWNTVFSRFCNEDRVEVGDIDVDIIESDRPKIFEYIVSRFGTKKTARVSSFGTIADKGTIDDIGGALRIIWNRENDRKDNDNSSDNPYSLPTIDNIKKDFEKDEDFARKKYPDIFYYFDGMVGTRISQSIHPAGMVISPITLSDNYGVFNKDGDICLVLDMEEVHEIGLVKYDFLILNNIKIIQDTYNMIGKPYPKSHEIDWEDKKVWEDMLKSPTGIFQFEGEFAHSLLKKYKPESIFDMSLVTAAIRPTGASYRNDLIERKRKKNPSKLIDDILKDNNGYLIYQEDTIKFLELVCGLSGSEADNVRRAIGRKDKDRLNKALPNIVEGYCSMSDKPIEVSKKEVETFLQVIEDSASYQFGYNHSIAYCLIGYMCAYLRYYYPYEFITSYLNNAANESDIANGTSLAYEYGITITPPKYGLSMGNYIYNKEKKVIAKGISSVKYLNSTVPKELYKIYTEYKTDSFMDLLLKISKETSLNSRQLEILIKIDFFSDFGNIRELIAINNYFVFFKQGEAKSVKKDKLSLELENVVKKYATDLGANGNVLKSYTIKDMKGLLLELEDSVLQLKIEDLNYKTKIQNQLDYLGYVDLTTNKPEDRRNLIITDIIPLIDKRTEKPWCYRANTKSIGSGKSARVSIRSSIFDKSPLKNGDVVYASSLSKNNKGFWYLDKYEILV